MPVPIATRATKYLEGTQFYKRVDEIAWSDWEQKVALQPSESVIGVYQNLPNRIENSIVVTSLGLHYVSDSSSKFIQYESIREMDYPSHNMPFLFENPDQRLLVTHLNNGEEIIRLPVLGNVGRGLDVISFNLFVRGACQTLDIVARKQNEDR